MRSFVEMCEIGVEDNEGGEFRFVWGVWRVVAGGCSGENGIGLDKRIGERGRACGLGTYRVGQKALRRLWLSQQQLVPQQIAGHAQRV